MNDITCNTYKEIEKLAPFGTGNEKPNFLLKDIKINNIKHFGKEKNHLEISFIKDNGDPINAMGFFMKSDQFKNRDGKEIKKGDIIDMVATIEKSMFRGRPELRLRIVDIL